ncbi:MAG: hypothetical protein MJ113_07740 [Lachnospiraceae bacterium]|nr:hypothetical protein [Lachnospiraceae bacterium]
MKNSLNKIMIFLLPLLVAIVFMGCAKKPLEYADTVDNTLDYKGRMLFSYGVTTAGRIADADIENCITVPDVIGMKIEKEHYTFPASTIDAYVDALLSKYTYRNEAGEDVVATCTDEVIEKYFPEYKTAKKFKAAKQAELENKALVQYIKNFLIENSVLNSYSQDYYDKKIEAYDNQYTYQYEFYNNLYQSAEGIPLYESIYDYYSVSPEEYQENLEKSVIDDLKLALACQKIAYENRITVDEDDVASYLLSEGHETASANTLKSSYGYPYFAQLALQDKVIRLIIDKKK